LQKKRMGNQERNKMEKKTKLAGNMEKKTKFAGNKPHLQSPASWGWADLG